MTNPLIFDGETTREMNKAELAQHKLDTAAALLRQETEAAESAEREATRQALLDRLGITADEAQLLLG